MKEVFEKIIERLEEEREWSSTHGKDVKFREGRLSGLRTGMRIVNQAAEEYNDGWIPCKKDLPKISNSYLVTKMYENDGNPIYETAHEIFWIKDMKWDCERDEFCVWKVIAWQNKLTPYRPEGDKNE